IGIYNYDHSCKQGCIIIGNFVALPSCQPNGYSNECRYGCNCITAMVKSICLDHITVYFLAGAQHIAEQKFFDKYDKNQYDQCIGLRSFMRLQDMPDTIPYDNNCCSYESQRD